MSDRILCILSVSKPNCYCCYFWVGLLLGIVEFSGAGGIWSLGLGNWDWSSGESG